MTVVSADVEVLVWFDLSATGGDFFTLNDPVKGKLDDTTYRLAGDLPQDITSHVLSLSTSRGKRSQLDPDIGAGSLVVTLDNSDRTFDPLYVSSPFFGNIVPGKRIRVSAAGVPIFDGLIEDWDFAYSPQRVATCTIHAADALATLARCRFLEWTTTASQSASERIEDVLDRAEVSFPANRNISGGQSVLQDDLVTWGSNVLNYLQLVARSELGWLYASRDGVLTFRDRHAAVNGQPVVTFDDTGEPSFHEVEVSYGSELLFNRVSIDREGGIAQTSTDADSIAAYGARGLAIPGLLLDSDAQSADMADYLLGRYREPELRFSSLTVKTEGLEPSDRASVVALDITDVIGVRWTPSGVGAQTDRKAVVIGVAHRITPAQHEVVLYLSDADRNAYLTLDDPVFGRLDFNLLAF